jgi:hypothetical protein
MIVTAFKADGTIDTTGSGTSDRRYGARKAPNFAGALDFPHAVVDYAVAASAGRSVHLQILRLDTGDSRI